MKTGKGTASLFSFVYYFLCPTKVGTSHYATSLWHFYYCEKLILPQVLLFLFPSFLLGDDLGEKKGKEKKEPVAKSRVFPCYFWVRKWTYGFQIEFLNSLACQRPCLHIVAKLVKNFSYPDPLLLTVLPQCKYSYCILNQSVLTILVQRKYFFG